MERLPVGLFYEYTGGSQATAMGSQVTISLD